MSTNKIAIEGKKKIGRVVTLPGDVEDELKSYLKRFDNMMFGLSITDY